MLAYEVALSAVKSYLLRFFVHHALHDSTASVDDLRFKALTRSSMASGRSNGSMLLCSGSKFNALKRRSKSKPLDGRFCHTDLTNPTERII